MDWMRLALVVIGCAGLSGALTYGLIRLLAARGVMDLPNHRSLHRLPVPRGGGAGPVLVILAALVWLAISGTVSFGLVAAAAGIAALSLADDLRGLPWWLRLCGQGAAVALALAGMRQPLPVFFAPELMALDLAVIALAWLWFVNLYNFMDGIDGLAGGEAVSICAGLVLLALVEAGTGPGWLLPAVIGAAAAGFLVWNWQPARIFMGDVGSITLGFIIGYCLIVLAGQGALAAALILPGYFLIDATWTLAQRLARRAPVWRAHREHAYQRAVQAGWSHRRTVLAIMAGNAVLVALALYSLAQPLVALALAACVAGGLRAFLARSG